MIQWAPITFVRVVILFIAGIAAGIAWPLVGPVTVVALVLFMALLIYYSLRIRQGFARETRSASGLIGLLIVFAAGYVNVQFHEQSRRDDHVSRYVGLIKYYTCTVTNGAHDKANSWKQEVKVTRAFTDKWIKVQGNILIYFSKTTFKKPFKYGDILVVEGSPQPLHRASNPGEFDYSRYLSYQNIFHQQAIGKSGVVKVGEDIPSLFMASAIRVRNWADSVLRENVIGAREQAIASALVLGVTDGLDNDLLTAYAATGAMHVLAVSGLHISIIYMLVVALLRPLKKTRSGQWALAFISLVLLWGYAFVTGLSPSVLRAVTMFSFVAIAKPVGRNTNIFNTMAASAFFLLMYDPFLIMSVGFQLSYMAVIGIVAIHPDLYASWQPRLRVVDEVWKISSVSIAAQISTFGLGLLYFHQFPNFFLLSNLLVIPISFVVLIDGIAVLAMAWVDVLASWLGWLLTWLIKIMNLAVFAVEMLPYNLVENIYISTAQCWLLIVLASAIVMLFKQRNFRWLIASASVAFLFTIFQWQHYLTKVRGAAITVYNVRGHTAIDLTENGRYFFITDSAYRKNVPDIKFHIVPNRVIHSASTVLPDSLIGFRQVNGGKVFSWNKKLIGIICGAEFNPPRGSTFDFLIISENCNVDIGRMCEISNHVIIDGSNSYYYSKRMTDIALKKNLSIHSVVLDGAYQVKLDPG